jgi:hypothetical protein
MGVECAKPGAIAEYLGSPPGLVPKQLPEEIARLPRRSFVLLGHVISHQHTDLQILDGSIEVERLVHVVTGRVVASLNLVLDEFPSV